MDSVMDAGVLPRPVSGFGHLRVVAWLAARRSFTQPSHVLHRLSAPEHPPNTLEYLTTFTSRIAFDRSRHRYSVRCVVVIPHPTCQRSLFPQRHRGGLAATPWLGTPAELARSSRSCSNAGREAVSPTGLRLVEGALGCSAPAALTARHRSLVVEATGLEPATSCLQSRSSTS